MIRVLRLVKVEGMRLFCWVAHGSSGGIQCGCT